MNDHEKCQLERRKVMKTIASLAAVAVVPAVAGRVSARELFARPPGKPDRPDRPDGPPGGTSGGTAEPAEGGDNPSADWLSGGTKSMTADFPDDSIFATGATCTVALTEQRTEGPCYFDSVYREDISEGLVGLPTQLCFQLTNESCEPLAGYEIEVWHCSVEGVYSGDTSDASDTGRFNSSYCTGDAEDALASQWFRGIAVTDSSGRVNFKTCFPGWYSSRAIHIHFRVRSNNADSVVSQFGFGDYFCQSICTTHEDYVSRGEPDTYMNNDTVFDGPDETYMFNLQANTDGSLLAYKRLMISES
ncbi:intradiol ring-cleavage dioxygenase [Vibrio quintilis]|uniref:Chlorocatechol 1,2-dioxygenase n=1 Tax=Vibrio quintilis TaxID=1117707 RepID=A0A1M7Z0G1_9VIBR|nr:intradiol ring-cleavage dioxygenase [Vibrio quintilis]SHO58302.1 Chlorocatechol 1,2-dioxygenase [Vibrio quintilis]